jgi:hypothetical protein
MQFGQRAADDGLGRRHTGMIPFVEPLYKPERAART